MASRNPSKYRKTSQVWEYFSDIGDNKAKCNFCSKLISYRGGNIFNLNRHVRTVHPTICLSTQRLNPARPDSPDDPDTVISEPSIISAAAAIAAASTPDVTSTTNANTTTTTAAATTTTTATTMPSAFRKTQNAIASYFPKPLTNKNSKEIDFLLLKALVKNYLPFQIVENSDFRQFVRKLNSSYTMPGRKTVSNDLLSQLYSVTKERVREQLRPASSVRITTDCWRSLANENYISVTAHYLDNDCNLKSSLLDCFVYEQKHTAANLAEELKRITREWGVESKISGVVTDNAANIVAAVRLTGWKHIPCFAHTLNLIVQYGLQNVKDVVTKVKTIVEFFKRSPQACGKLKAMQEQLGEPCLSLKQDIVTRWNSTYDMLQRIVNVKNSLMSVIAINYPEVPTLTNEDIGVITEICNLLKVFKDCTVEMSSEKQVTISKVILLYQALKKWCSTIRCQAGENSQVGFMAEELLEALEKRFKGIEENKIFAEATLLDPRFKSHGFSDGRYFQRAKQTLIAHCEKCQPIASNQQSVSAVPEPASSSIWEEFDLTVSDLIRHPHPKVAAIVEVDKYIQEPLLPRIDDPLAWWLERRQVYPSLFELAKSRLCIVATSVPCERVFSKAGQTVTERRNRLTGKKCSKFYFCMGICKECHK